MALGTGALIIDEPFTYSDGPAGGGSDVTGGNWLNPLWSGQGPMAIASNRLTQGGAAGWDDCYSKSAWAPRFAEYILRDVTMPDSTNQLIFEFCIDAADVGGGGPDSYALNFRPGTSVNLQRWVAGAATTIVTTGITSPSNGYDWLVRFSDNGDLSVWNCATGTEAWVQQGSTYNDGSPWAAGRLGFETNANTVSLAGLEVRELSDLQVPPSITWGAIAVTTDSTAPYTVTPTLPSHQADDILIVAAIKNNGANLTCGTSGWAEIITGQNSANLSTAWFWKRATSGAETNPVITSSTTGGTVGIYAVAARVRGCVVTGTPFEDATLNGTPTSSTTPASATITTTGPNRLAVAIASIDDDPAPSSGWPPSGWAANASVRTTTGSDASLLSMSKAIVSAGDATGVTMATLPGADYWKTLTLAFIPPTVGDDVPPVPNIITGPSLTKISDEAGFDSTDITVQIDEDCQAWKVKVVPATDSIHTAGTEIESGGSVAENGTVNVNITDDELLAAGAVGNNIVKFFFQDNAGNWSV